MNRLAVSIAFVVLFAVLSAVPLPSRVSPAHAQTDPVLDVIARINAYRVEQGLQPLAINARLEAMARDQAEYIASLPDIPDGGDIHLGRRREDARQRAAAAPYLWETYGNSKQISVSEIAGVGTVNSVFTFWMGSTLHRNTIINPAYREIGVSAVKHPFGYIIMAVLGGRPDELPVLLDPGTNRLYIPNEYYARGSGNWLHQVKTIRLFGEDGRPLTGERAWTSPLNVPPGAGDQVFVLFDDGNTQLLRVVDLAHDIAILPDTLAMVAAGATATSQPATVVASAPSATPTQPGQVAQVTASTPIPTPTTAPRPTATATAT
ncbi:MAG: CAP domain-containing protein, partial [Chloroflexi bacterium]